MVGSFAAQRTNRIDIRGPACRQIPGDGADGQQQVFFIFTERW
jgi:hypothetical protein